MTSTTNTPRTAIVEIAVPAHVSDQDFANRLRRVIAQACFDQSAEAKAFRENTPPPAYPDPATLEVTVYGCAAAALFTPAPKDPS